MAILDVVTGLVVAALLVAITPGSRLAQPDTVQLDPLGYALLAATGLALTVRRRWPLTSYLAGTGAAVAYLALRFPGWPVYIGAALALIAYLSSRGLAGWVPALIGGAGLAVATGRPEEWHPIRMLSVFLAWLAIAAFTAYVAWLRRRSVEEVARRRGVEERLRIAREMHDVLSYSLAAISVQAGAGLRLFHTSPDQAESALRSIRQVSKDALAQSRWTLAAARERATPDAPPAPGVQDLDRLFASVRDTGLAVQPSVELDGAAIPPAVGLAAYRVVQESLTNVVRHAGAGACAAVAVRRQPGAVVVEVTDNGVGGGATPAPAGTGHGITGMRERALELGGELIAGPRTGGGFRVWARLPIGPPAP